VLSLGVDVGGSSPPHCTALGKAILAFLPQDECLSVMDQLHFAARTPRTITRKAVFMKELKTIRERGYSVDNEEFERGLKSFGAPVRNYSGKVVAAISVAGPAFRLTKANSARINSIVTQTANELSAELGFRSLSGKV